MGTADDLCGIRAPPSGHRRHCTHHQHLLLGYAQIMLYLLSKTANMLKSPHAVLQGCFGGGGLLRKERKTIASVWFLVTSRLKHSGLGCLDIHHNATLMEEAWPAAARVTVVAGG